MVLPVSSQTSTPTPLPQGPKTSEMASKELAGDLQSFLKILTVQMQNQDPFNPTDSSEFVAQLTQFANVEQNIRQNKNLEELIKVQKNQQAIQAVNFMGKNVKYVGDKLYYDGKNPTPVSIDIPKDIPNLNYTIVDKDGRFVFSNTVSAAAGTYKFDVGPDSTNQALPAGIYQIRITAMDRNHNPMKDAKDDLLELCAEIQGKVTTVEKGQNDWVLKIDDVTVPFNTINSFFNEKQLEVPVFHPSLAGQSPSSLATKPHIPPLPLAMEEAMQ